MSRSKRKNYVMPICCTGGSQKPWKTQINRIFRRKSKARLDSSIDDNGVPIRDYFYRDKNKRKFADIWLSPSDGKHTITMLNRSDWLKLKEEDMNRDKLPWYKFLSSNNLSRWGAWYDPSHKTYKEYVANFKRQIITK